MQIFLQRFVSTKRKKKKTYFRGVLQVGRGWAEDLLVRPNTDKAIAHQRNGKYKNNNKSRWKVSFSYIVGQSDGNDNNVPVCSLTFKQIFAITGL